MDIKQFTEHEPEFCFWSSDAPASKRCWPSQSGPLTNPLTSQSVNLPRPQNDVDHLSPGLLLILWYLGLKTMLTISFRASYWSILYYLVHTMITSIGSARVVSWAVYRDVIIINCCVWYFNLIIWIILPCDKQNKYVIIGSLLFYDDVIVCSIFTIMVKVRPFVEPL